MIFGCNYLLRTEEVSNSVISANAIVDRKLFSIIYIFFLARQALREDKMNSRLMFTRQTGLMTFVADVIKILFLAH